MKFGVFFELSVPTPVSRAGEQQAYANALEQAVLADELGFDFVWAVEHHFLEGYSHCSSPEVFLTAVAARTSRIRVGHGAVVCVPEMNHPVRVAERAAALDILSGGRLELGTARSSTWTELGGFGTDPDLTKKTWDEYVRIIPQMWTQDRFSFDGLSCHVPERNVLPKPMQDPHPPMWVTVTTPGHRARRGGSWHRVPRCRGRDVRRAGAAHRRVPPAHRALRPRRIDRHERRHDAELLVLPRGHRRRRRARGAHGRRVLPPELAPALDARGLPHERVPVARQPGDHVR